MNRRRSIFKSGRGLVLLLALVLGLSLGMSTDPVLANGCDINVPGDQTTIQAAVNAATAGQTICVAAGTYNEDVTIVANRANLTIQGASSDTTILNGGIRTGNNNGIAIQNLTVVGGNDWGPDGSDDPGIWLESGNGHALENIVLDGTGHTNSARGILFGYDVTGISLTDVSVSNWVSGIYINPRGSVILTRYTGNTGGSISADGPLGFTVIDSTFVDSGLGLTDYDAPVSPSGISISGTSFSGTATALNLWDAQADGWVAGSITIENSTFDGSVPLRLSKGAAWPPSEVTSINGLVINTQDNTVSVGPNSFVENSISPIAAGILLAHNQGTVNVATGTYVESNSIAIDQDITIIGDQSNKPVIKPNGNQNAAWFSVSNAATLNMSNVVLDGDTHFVWTGIQVAGATATLDGVDFKNIQGSASGQPYRGVAIAVFGGTVGGGAGAGTHAPAHLALSGSTFEQIGRIGVLVKGDASTADISGNTYTGKGDGDFLDYAFEVGAGGSATVTGNTITNNKGVATADGSTSAGILVTTFWGAGTQATITGNDIVDNTSGIVVGYDGSDTSTVVAHFNNLNGNVDAGIESTGPAVNAENNWWGNTSGPSGEGPGSGDSVSVNVDFDPWLGAALDDVSSTTLAPGGTLDGPDGSSATNSASSTNNFLVILSKFIGNPSSVPNFAGASAFYDIFVSGATATDSLDVVLPAAGDGFLYFYDGSEWVEVLNGGSPISPDGGFYTFILDDTSTPKLTELDGTPFTGAGNEEIRITPSTTTVAAGETFQVVVDAGSDALFGVDVSLSFSTTVFSVTNISLGNGLTPGTIAVNTFDNGAGTLRFAYSQLGASVDNVVGTDLVLATITFLAHTDGNGEIALDTSLFTDKDGNPATPAPLDSPIALTVDPSPTVFVDVALQGRSDYAGLQLEVKPTGTGNILYDADVVAGQLEIENVPAGAYTARVSAPKYLAAIQDFTLLATESSHDLGGPLVLRGGDINADDQINIQDLVLIGVNFGTNTASVDINGDGPVNIQDLAIAAGNYGLKTGGPSFSGYPGNWE